MNRLILAFAVAILCSASMVAQDEPQPVVLTETVQGRFGTVWESLKTAIEEFGCPKPQVIKVIEPAEEGGLYKGQYVSDYCVLAQGEDTTKATIQKYSDVPRIRGGIWVTCRVQYKINVREEEGGITKIILRAEMSGFEEFITAANHFWVSNGILERQMMETIMAKVKKKQAESGN
jgi:hypothetical protein